MTPKVRIRWGLRARDSARQSPLVPPGAIFGSPSRILASQTLSPWVPDPGLRVPRVPAYTTFVGAVMTAGRVRGRNPWWGSHKDPQERVPGDTPAMSTKVEGLEGPHGGCTPWPVGHDDGGQGPASKGDHRRGDPQGTLSSWSLLGVPGLKTRHGVLRQLFSFIIFDWENSCHRRQPHGEPQEREP